MQASDRPEVVSRNQPGGPFRGYTPAQMLYLVRLKSLIAKRQQYAGRVDPGDWRMRLLDKALYSTYTDCVDLGITGEARDLLRQLHQAQVS
jgi:hypothetical protein